MRKTLLILCLMGLCACTTTYKNIQAYLDAKHVTPPTKDTFQSCRGYGCQYTDDITFSKQNWTTIDNIFSPKSNTPAQERERIKKAIKTFETLVGDQTGTNVDVAGTFRETGFYQQDCVDESTNTTVYLNILEQRGHLEFHTIQPPTARLPIINAGRWPHQTAIITEKQNEESYAVDSWFHSNGHEPEIVPLKRWKDGWKPDTIKFNMNQ